MNFLSRLKGLIEEFLFPKSENVLELEALSSEKVLALLPRAGNISKNTLALFDYSHPLVKEMIWELKYNGNRNIADKFGEILYDTIVSELEERSPFETWGRAVVIPIPVSDKRRFERGWNQSELLLNAVEKRDASNIFKYLPRHLVKVRHTESQTKTSNKQERERNLKDSMKMLTDSKVRGQCIILIDDVTTTGSTFAEAQRALKDAGAKKILSIAIAH